MVVYRKNEVTGWRTLEASSLTNQEIRTEVNIATRVLISNKRWWESRRTFLKRANKMFGRFVDVTILLNGKAL